MPYRPGGFRTKRIKKTDTGRVSVARSEDYRCLHSARGRLRALRGLWLFLHKEENGDDDHDHNDSYKPIHVRNYESKVLKLLTFGNTDEYYLFSSLSVFLSI